jgi:two-component system, OmpR family, phosphate regulon sensor histidine kinase PhoR
MNFDDTTLVQSNSQSGLQPENELEFANLLINQATQAVFCLGAKTQFLYVNDVTCCMTEYSREELLAMTLLDIDIDCSINQWLQQWQYLTTKSRSSLTFESRYRTKGGRIFLVEITLTYLQYKGKGFACAFVRELIAGIDQSVRHLGELRSKLMAIICHKFRIPLNVVSFSSSLLKRNLDAWTGEKIRSLLDGMQISVAQIDKLLEYILFYEEAELEKLKFVPKPLDLLPFCHQLVAQIQMSSSQNPINFVHQGQCVIFHIAPEVLEQILTKLLDNAMKYSPSYGAINLKLFCEPKQIIFQVQDTGIGIPPKEQRQVFEPLYRGSNVKHIPGSGLGLSMVKTLVDLYGGQIAVASELDVGTNVTLMLPTGD